MLNFALNRMVTLFVLGLSSLVLLAPGPAPGGARPVVVPGVPVVTGAPGSGGTRPLIPGPLPPAICAPAVTSGVDSTCAGLGCSGKWECPSGYTLTVPSQGTVTGMCNSIGTCPQPSGLPPRCAPASPEDSIFAPPRESEGPTGTRPLPALVSANWKGGYCAIRSCVINVRCPTAGCNPNPLTLPGRCQSSTRCTEALNTTLPQCRR